ncbi:MAG: Fe-S cluster protein [Deltaproteobacteria bacterium]|nr:Fe-S cluster protein [Deltaproteobacteria bacterium]
MLLKTYTKKIFRAECNPRFESLHCIARLDQDVSEALPYLNTVLGGFEYLRDPPAVMFRSRGRLITVHAREIAVNALMDEAEADKILEWLKREINQAWDNRAAITPSTEGAPRPQVLEILKLLPHTNCRQCGEPTCMVFAARAAEGIKSATDCPPLTVEAQKRLGDYLSRFNFDV